MIETTVVALVQKPVSDVYNYVRSLETQVFYNSSIRDVTKISNSEYKMKIDLGLLTLNEVYKVKVEEENVFFEAECETTSLSFLDRYEFKQVGQNTELRITDFMELKGLFRLSEGLVRMNLKSQMAENLKKLVSNLEKI